MLALVAAMRMRGRGVRVTVKKWRQRSWALVRWSVWSWRERRRAAALDPRQDRRERGGGGRRLCGPGECGRIAARARTEASDARLSPAAEDEPSEPVRSAVQVHMLMSRAELDLWQTFAERRWLELDDAVHAAALCGLTYHLARDGDEGGRHAAEVCAWELIARLGLDRPGSPVAP
jgi:hypothetical protein